MHGGLRWTALGCAVLFAGWATDLTAQGTVELAAEGSLQFRASRQAPRWWDAAQEHLRNGQTAAAFALLEQLHRDAADQFVAQDGSFATADWLIEQFVDKLSPADRRTWDAALAPRAQVVWDRWQAERQLSDLLVLCRSYASSEPGLRAWQALAALNRDAGRKHHALAAYDVVLRHRRASRQERAAALVAQAALWSDLHRPERIAALWEQHQLEFATVVLSRGGRSTTVADELSRHLPTAASTAQAVAPSLPTVPAGWSHELSLPEKLQPVWNERLPQFRAAGAYPLPVNEPLLADSCVLVRTATDLVAFDAGLGTVRWRIPQLDFAWMQNTPGSLDNRGLLNSFVGQLFRRAHADTVLGRITTDGQCVFALHDTRYMTTDMSSRQPVFPPAEGTGTPRAPFNWLSAYRLADGELAWRLGGGSAGSTYPLAGEFFCGPPTPWDDLLFVVSQHGAEVRLLALRADHGNIEWHTALGDTPRELVTNGLRQRAGCPVTIHQGMLLCPTAAGAVVAVDPLTQSPRWAYRYPVEERVVPLDSRQPVLGGAPDAWWVGWRDISVHSAGELAVFVSPETNRLHAVDVLTGRARWTAHRSGGLVLLGVTNEFALVAEPTAVRAHRLTTGDVAWRTPIGELTGRGAIVGDRLLLPAQPEGLLTLQIADGQIVSSPDSSRAALGNLIGSTQGWFATSATAAVRLPDRSASTLAGEGDGRRLALLADLKRDPQKWRELRTAWSSPSETPQQQLELDLAVIRAAIAAGDFRDAAAQILTLSERTPREEFLTQFNPRRSARADLAVVAAWDDLERAAPPAELAPLRALLTASWDAARHNADPFALQRWWERWQPLPFVRQPQHTAEPRVFLGQPMAAVELALLSSSDPTVRPAWLWQLADELSRAGFHREADDSRRRLTQHHPGAILPNGESVSRTLARSGGLSEQVDLWPSVLPEIETQGNQLNDNIHHIAVPLDAESTGLFERLDVTIDRQGRRLRFSGGGHRGAWELPLPKSTSPLRHEPSLVQGWGRGQLLVLRVGTELIAVLPFDDRGEPAGRVLWQLDTVGGGAWTSESLVMQPLPAVPGVRLDEYRVLDGFGRVLGQVGPVRAAWLCYHEQARLVCVETLTGRKRWERFDLPLDAVTFGDDDTVVIWSAGERRVEMVRAIDGTTLSQRAWTVSADDIVLQRDRRAWRVERGKAPRLLCEDVVTGTTHWTAPLAIGAIPFALDGDTLGVVDLRGLCFVLSAEDSSPRGEALTLDLPALIEKVVVSRDPDRWYVAFSERTPQQAALQLAQGRLVYRAPVVTGPLYAVDRASPHVVWRANLNREAWPIEQPKSVPVLVQTYRVTNEAGPISPNQVPVVGVLHLRDKRTGRDVLRREDVNPATYTTVYGDPDRGVIDVHLERMSFKLRYQPTPPAPPLPNE